MCFTPIIAFADSLYYEVMDDEYLTIVQIDENRNFVCKDEYGEDITQLESHLNKSQMKEIMEYFKSYVKESDITNYNPQRTLQNYENGKFFKNGYILRICEKSECKEYFSETPIISYHEVNYGKLQEVRKAEDAKSIAILLLPIIIIIMTPIILAIVTAVVLIFIFRKKKKNNPNSQPRN